MDGEQQTPMPAAAIEQEVAARMHQDATDTLIAQAVRSAPLRALPVDFAAQVAATIASKPEESISELYFAAALLVLLGLSGLCYAGIFVMENFGSSIRSNLPLIITLLTIIAVVQGWEVLKRLAEQRSPNNLLL